VQALPWQQLVGQSIEGKYHLTRFIDAGSFGSVYQADEVVGDVVMRSVAFKLLRPPTTTVEGNPATPEQRDALLDRQLAELQFAAQLDHPGLIRTYSVGMTRLAPPAPAGLEDELLYIVMELGVTTLTEELAAGPLKPDAALDLLRQLTDVLAYLHDAAGVAPGGVLIHRDIKPANILLVRGALGKQRWKLSDLGTMRPFGAPDASRLDRMGTAEYAPPEAYDGKVSPAWDIWSLGVVLCEALSGELPFGPAGAPHTAATLERSVSQDAPRLPKPLPPPFDKLLPGMLHKDPAQRLTVAQIQRVLGAGQPAPAVDAASPPAAAAEPGRGRPAGPSPRGTFPTVAAPAPWAPPPRPAPGPVATGVPDYDTAAERQLRLAIQRALEDKVITPYERSELNELRKRLDIRLERAAAIFREEQASSGTGAPQAGPLNVAAPSAPPLAPPQAPGLAARPAAALERPAPPLNLPEPDPGSFRRFSAAALEGSGLEPPHTPVPVPAAPAGPPTLVVDADPAGKGDYRTIGGALTAIRPGGRIVVRPGLYREALLVSQPVEIVAEGPRGSVIVESRNRHTAVVNSDGVTLRHLLLRAVSDGAGSTAGEVAVSALVVSRGRMEAENCVFDCNSENCVAVFGDTSVPRLSNCQLSGARSVGLSATHDARAVAEACQIVGSGLAAAMCSNGGQLRLERCRLSSGKRYGVLVYVEGLATLKQCEISGNGEDGVALKNGGRADLTDCAVRQNGGHAVLVQQGCRASIAGCDLRGNRQGPFELGRGAAVARRENQE
jgi:hypothetical protein